MSRLAAHLTDLCFLECALVIFNKERRYLEAELDDLIREEEPQMPQSPGINSLYRLLYIPVILSALLSIFVIGFLIKFFFVNWFSALLLAIPGIPLALLLGAPAVMLSEKISECRKKRLEGNSRYEYEVETYETRLEQWRRNQACIPNLEEKLDHLNQDIACIRNGLDDVYRQNYIPRPYRNTEAIIFLYDWFSSCQSEDLENAIKMYMREREKYARWREKMHDDCRYAELYEELRHEISDDLRKLTEGLWFR